MLDCGGRADRGYARGDCRAAEIIAIVKRMMREPEAVACETSRAADRSRSTCRPLHRRNAQPGRPHDADHRQVLALVHLRHPRSLIRTPIPPLPGRYGRPDPQDLGSTVLEGVLM